MSHLTLSSCMLGLGLVVSAAASHAASLTEQSGLTVLVGRGGGGHSFGGYGGFARSNGRVMDDAYRGRDWNGGVYIGDGGYGYDYCGAYPLGDWPRGTCDQF
jgi:hypothetical protein